MACMAHKNKGRKIPAFVTNFLLIREFHLVFQRYGYYNSGILENKAGFLKNKLDKTEQCKDEH